jgi:3-oxoacyl-[acyl-carrier-protein] synthase-3
MTIGAGGAEMRSLAVAFPSILRTNDYWRERRPDMVARAEEYSLARLWGRDQKADAAAAPSAFERTMAPHLADPFRGAVERRIRAPGETALSMELAAARAALDALSLTPSDIDLALVSSFVGDRFGVGNASYFARELGLRAPAWNFETACSSSLVGLHMAASLVRSADYRRVLVVVSTSNSVQVEDDDTMGWFVGDGAGAFVVERAPWSTGVLGWKTINSIGTNDMFVIRSIPEPASGGTRLCTVPNAQAAAMARDTAEPYLLETVSGALSMAKLEVRDVDFWVFNTPNAWYAEFCGEVLGVGADRYHSVYPRYANIGGALMPATLYHALESKRVQPGQLVGLYSIGSSSTAAAVVMRAGNIALGPFPERPSIRDASTSSVGASP